MTTVPPPNLWNAEAPESQRPEQAVETISPPVSTAEPFDESPLQQKEEVREAPVASPPNTMATGVTDCIHEIFHHARLLVAEDNSVHRRFVLNEAAFMEAIEPMPLFLQMRS